MQVDVYRVRPLFRFPALLVLVGALSVDVFFLVAGLVGRSGLDLGGALLFIVLSSPLLLLAPLYLLYHNSGEVILADDAVIVRRWGRDKGLRYDDVVEVRELDWNLPPNLVLRGPERSVGINTQVEHFSELYELLSQRVEVMRRRAEAGFPLALQVTTRYQAWLVVGLVLYMALYLGLGLLPIWSELFSEAPDFSVVLLRNTFIWFALLSFFFVPGLYAVVVGAMAGSLQGGQPIAYEFTEEAVRYRLPFGLWRSRPVSELRGIYLKWEQVRVRVSHGGSTVAEDLVKREIALQFAGGWMTELSLDRIRQFGFTPNELFARLGALYPRVPRAELRGEQIVGTPIEGETAETALLPYTLRLRPLSFLNALAGTAFFALCFLGSVGIHAWLIVSDDPGASDNHIFWMSMALWGTVFLAMTVGVFFSVFHPRQPYKLVLTVEEIRFRYILGRWRSWPVSELQGIELRTVRKRQTRKRGGRYVAVMVTKQWVDLIFSGGRTLSIDDERAKQFGLTPPALQALLQSLYGEK